MAGQVLLALYFVFLALFLRFFWWKRFADRRYWRQRPELSIARVQELAARRGRELPFISLLVPARNEADVIANTVEHLAHLEYPRDRYEIVVITDEKELRAYRRGEHPGPTTQQVVEAKQQEWQRLGDKPQLKHVIVPCDFSGRFRGGCTGYDVPSTKARALNYGLEFVDPRTEICGFYDAESHPEPQAPLYIAYRWLITGGRVRVWQGPVFQVRNFFALGPVTKVAALYQALAHEWYYPVLMQRLPFIGGTNFYASRHLLEELGGFDAQALTEDLDFGVRAYLKGNAWPEYAPFYSTEQTPATLRAFLRQRLRWASGHLQVVDKLRRNREYPERKRRQVLCRLYLKGQVEWTLYQLACLLPVILCPIALVGWVDLSSGVPTWINPWLRLNLVAYYGFTFYLWYRYRRLIDARLAPAGRLSRWLAPLELLVLPVAGFFFPLPYSSAMVLKVLGRAPQTWVKTPRTRETAPTPAPAVRSPGQLAMRTREAAHRP
ncbi:MAG: glycosyltransferase [Moorellales bacterium]